MAAPVQRIPLPFSRAFYVVFLPLCTIFGSVIGNIVFRLPWVLVVPASAGFAIFFEGCVSVSLFTTIEIGRDSLRLISPLRRIVLVRSDLASYNLWMRSPDEEKRPLWNQAAILYLFLRNGRRIVLGGVGITPLRAIISWANAAVSSANPPLEPLVSP